MAADGGCPASMTLSNGMCSLLFSYTGAPQTFTVPTGVSELTIDAWGATGGGSVSGGPDGGRGGEEKATLLVTAGESLTIIVGQWGGQGSCASPGKCTAGAGGYGGGGAGGNYRAGGGGGGSFVFGPAGRLLLAAGGGGGNPNGTGSGGAGGGTEGGVAGSNASSPDYPVESPAARGGGGGTETAGGAGGSYGNLTTSSCGRDGNAGTSGSGPATGPSSFAPGGKGGDILFEQTPCYFAGLGSGGGGGGGYYGGGGGGSGYYSGGGGGGGSGYVEADAQNAVSGLNPYASGNGQVTLSVARVGPEVDRVDPASGPLKGGQVITATGWGLAAVNAARFELHCGGTTIDIAADSFTREGDSKLSVTTPNLLYAYEHNRASFAGCDPARLGSDLQARVPTTGAAGNIWTVADPARDGYTFLGPSVASVSPASGPSKGNQSIIVKGAGFTGADRARFELRCASHVIDVPAASVQPRSDSLLAATTPNMQFIYQHNRSTFQGCSLSRLATDVEVHVSLGPRDAIGLWSAANPQDRYTFLNVPEITGATPNHGPYAGGNTITIQGVGLTGVDHILFQQGAFSQVVALQPNSSDTSLQVKVPPDIHAHPANPDVVDVIAAVGFRTPDEVRSKVAPADRYSYELKVTGVTPNRGPYAGGNTITVHGVGLTGVDHILFQQGGFSVVATPQPKGSDTSLQVRVPPDIHNHPPNPDVVDVIAAIGFRTPNQIMSRPTPEDRYSYVR